jgi:bifunctional UDP-N-acetylglucosamine pyrophosphorylase/glucosamine-1-phosphate N-acetyltransferase
MAIAVNRVIDTGAFGRVERDANGHVTGIVEALRQGEGIVERNAGFYVFDSPWLWENIQRVQPSANGELYLTALAAMAAEQGKAVATVEVPREDAMGVDDRVRLAEAEAVMRRRIVERLMLAGVTVRDPNTTYIDAAVDIGADVTIEPGCHIRGASRIAANTVIGPNTVLRDSTVGERCLVSQSTIEDSTIGDGVRVGPNSHVRGGASIGDGCELGNYAEVKNSVLGPGVKMHHFSYLGDADVGANVNYAAGAITCNYDGVSKHRTTIGAGAFIGCDTMLIAPVTIGEGAVTGAGAVITKDVAPGERVAGVPARPIPLGAKH